MKMVAVGGYAATAGKATIGAVLNVGPFPRGTVIRSVLARHYAPDCSGNRYAELYLGLLVNAMPIGNAVIDQFTQQFQTVIAGTSRGLLQTYFPVGSAWDGATQSYFMTNQPVEYNLPLNLTIRDRPFLSGWFSSSSGDGAGSCLLAVDAVSPDGRPWPE